MASALPFAGCIGDSSTGALSQSLTDDGGTDGGVDMSTPVADMAVAVPDMALPPTPPGARIRPRIPVVGSVAINAPMGLWDSKLNAACEPMQTIDGRVRCVPKNLYGDRPAGATYYYDSSCTKPFMLARRNLFIYPTCLPSSQIGLWSIRLKPRNRGVCDDQSFSPVMFAEVVTGEESVPLAPSSAKYYQFAGSDFGPPLGACVVSPIPTDYDKDYVVLRMAGYDYRELAEITELH